MTSNIGSEFLMDGNNKTNQKKVENELKNHFKPEFINRIDDIVYFNSLDVTVIKKIVNKFIKELEIRLSKLQITIEVSDKALEEIVSEGFDKIYGARPLKRFIQKNIETPLAREIIKGTVKEKSLVKIDFVNGEFIFN